MDNDLNVDLEENDLEENDLEENDLEENDLDENDLEENDLDDQWINDFNLDDIENDEFIACNNDISNNITTLKIYNIYVNKNNILTDISNETIMIYDDVIRRSDLIKLIKKNSISCDKHYKLYFLLKFNVDISYEYLNNFLDDGFEDRLENVIHDYVVSGGDDCVVDSSCFFTVCKDISDIAFIYEVAFLRKLASLYFIYFEKCDAEHVEYIPALKIPYYTDKKNRATKSKCVLKNSGGDRDRGRMNIKTRSRKFTLK